MCRERREYGEDNQDSSRDNYQERNGVGQGNKEEVK